MNRIGRQTERLTFGAGNRAEAREAVAEARNGSEEDVAILGTVCIRTPANDSPIVSVLVRSMARLGLAGMALLASQPAHAMDMERRLYFREPVKALRKAGTDVPDAKSMATGAIYRVKAETPFRLDLDGDGHYLVVSIRGGDPKAVYQSGGAFTSAHRRPVKIGSLRPGDGIEAANSGMAIIIELEDSRKLLIATAIDDRSNIVLQVVP